MNIAFPELPVRSFLVICLFSPIVVAALVRAWLPLWHSIRRQPSLQKAALRDHLEFDLSRNDSILTPCTIPKFGSVCVSSGFACRSVEPRSALRSAIAR